MKTVLACLFLFVATTAAAQNRNSIWCFGDSAGIDFSSGVPVTFVSGMDGRGTCCSIADTSGQLLFYGYSRATYPYFTGRVETRNHTIMQNGDSIAAVAWYNEMFIVPVPSSDSLFYIFSVVVAYPAPWAGLYYSIIDMSQNSGMGMVIQKNVQLNNHLAVDALTAIKHGNGRDWWVIFKDCSSTNNKFWFYIVTPNGINLDHVQNIGGVNTTNLANFTFSKAGDKALFTTYNGLVEILQFNRCNGIFDTALVVEPEITTQPLKGYWGSAFSSDASKIYVTTYHDTANYLFQWNLDAANISMSKDTLLAISDFRNEGGMLRLAPDNKIYLSTAWDNGFTYNYPYPDSTYNIYNMNLGVINSPDSLGAACNFQPFSFYLGGKRTYWGLPNNPDYDMGPLIGSSCDTITGISSSQISVSRPELYVYYHSGWQKVFINAKNIKGKNCLLQIFDVNGKEVFYSSKKTNPPYFTEDINISNLSNGMFLVSLTTEKEKLTKKFVKN